MGRRRSNRCQGCEGNIDLDYKQYNKLKQFTNRSGKILPRRATKLCEKHQRQAAEAVKAARYLGLLPYGDEHGNAWK
ncbi:30S ribosomal protein S18 [Candidatus Bipolaricaulota bacterium]|nr:30S ribosomal protein S18 [Candidatus Bipolaricaulota bacterium]